MPAPATAPRDRFALFGTPISHSLSPAFHNTLFAALSLPSHSYSLHETASFSDPSVLALLRSPSFAGAAVTMPHKVAALPYMDELVPEVQEIGSMNTIVVVGTNDDGTPRLVGRNTDTDGIRGALLASVPEGTRDGTAPFGEGRSGVVFGGGGTTRAAIYALSPLWLLNRDPAETAAIISTPSFAKYDLRALESEEQWTGEEAQRVACVVGAIPSVSPETEGERTVYRVAERVFEGARGEQRPFLDMAYKPHRTLMIELAEKYGWRTIGGIEALVHQAFAQDRHWLLDSPATRIEGLEAFPTEAWEVAAGRVRELAGVTGHS
ncbi:hypothetical protein JCM5296_000014 [Sporobolomyces johnsonii]